MPASIDIRSYSDNTPGTTPNIEIDEVQEPYSNHVLLSEAEYDDILKQIQGLKQAMAILQTEIQMLKDRNATL